MKENLEESLSGNETKAVKRSDTLENVALAAGKQSSSVTVTPSEMTKTEALAVAWTGLEALAHMNQAAIFKSKKHRSVWIELKLTDCDNSNGLVPLKQDEG